MLAISDLLMVEQIQLHLKGLDKIAVLRELVELPAEPLDDRAQKEMFLQALLDRERLHTTAIGDGIALPHTRNPLGGKLKRPLLAFGRSLDGVAFGALDGKPVRLFFLIACPTLTDHLAILARISRVLRDQTLKSELLSAIKPEEVLKSIREAELRMPK